VHKSTVTILKVTVRRQSCFISPVIDPPLICKFIFRLHKIAGSNVDLLRVN